MTGHIKQVEQRYVASLRGEKLGCFESPEAAQDAIDQKKRTIRVFNVLKAARGEGGWSEYDDVDEP